MKGYDRITQVQALTRQAADLIIKAARITTEGTDADAQTVAQAIGKIATARAAAQVLWKEMHPE
jgi:phage host-nuclease inhibitor protein Gam